MAARLASALALALALVLSVPLAAGADTATPAAGADAANDIIGLQLVASGLTSPVALVPAPDDSGRLFVVDQVGVIWIIQPDGTMSTTPFLDLRDRVIPVNPGYDERGMLGLAFHPDFASNGRFFVYYSQPLSASGPEGWDHTNVLSEFHVSADNPDQAVPSSEREMLSVDWPYLNHNGGTLAFGPDDGYLYLSMGDGGNADDVGMGHVDDWYAANEGGNGQDIQQNLRGSILRIDVDGGTPYGIPADNPFVNGQGLPETYAFGFRNPYRFSFDMGGNHNLLVGDAGQELWEEVDNVTKGGNYGWNVKEGTHCFDTAHPDDPQITDCPSVDNMGNPLIDPVIEIANSFQPGGLGATVIGGNVYRGTDVPALDGRYVFGMWSRGSTDAGDLLGGRLLVSTPQDAGMWSVEDLQITGMSDMTLSSFLLGFGQDNNGEVYVLTTDNVGPSGNTGKIYRITGPNYAQLQGGVALSASLYGANEVPPADPDGFGFAHIVVNAQYGGVCYRLSVANLATPTAAHIHIGGPGVNGGIVVPLTPVDPSGLWSGCVSVDPAVAQAIVDNPGAYYVNVHTTEYPAGAIRGQLEMAP